MEKFIEMLPPQAAVLDVGCGTGRDVLYLSKHASFVMGIDISSAMLAIASSKGATGLVLADFTELPASDGVFDGCWAAASLLHAPKAVAPDVLSDIRRVLRPNGTFFLCLKKGSGEGIQGSEAEARYFSLYERAEGDELLSG
ncbi:MAG: class I SAM-dependent methyltransferase, partial [Actinobacteria bacterium]|nr:class I SAM-dependent methyltransferase [Actinomycetota bacterium]